MDTTRHTIWAQGSPGQQKRCSRKLH